MWRAWLGLNITFGLLCLLIATQNFKLVERCDTIRPRTIAFSVAYLALSLHFWFYGPAIINPTGCLTVATVLSPWQGRRQRGAPAEARGMEVQE